MKQRTHTSSSLKFTIWDCCANQMVNGSEKLLSKFNHLSVFNRYLSQSLDQDLLDSIHVFSSFFYTKLSSRVQIGETFVLPG